MASKVQVNGVQVSVLKVKSQQIHKTESSDIGFMDFLFEEDTTENEEDNLFTPIILNSFSSYFNPVNNPISNVVTRYKKKAFAFLKTPIFLQFRNIRL